MRLSELRPGDWFIWNPTKERTMCVGHRGEHALCVNSGCERIYTTHHNNNEYVTMLPECTGWDWEPAPPPLQIEAGKRYADNCGIVHGPMTRQTDLWWTDGPLGDLNACYSSDGKFCNRAESERDLIREVRSPPTGVFTAVSDSVPVDSPSDAIPPQYRPFNNVDEFKPHRDRWVRRNAASGCFRIDAYTNKGCWCGGEPFESWEEFLAGGYRFDDDGTPCGVQVSP